MKVPKQLQLVFDFDGVLIDSRQESLLNAYNSSADKLHGSLTEISNHFQQLFELNRPHVRSAGELVCLANWCIEQSDCELCQLSIAEFDYLLASWSDFALKEQKFFAKRKELQKLLGSAWYELQRPFQPLWDFVKQQAGEVLIVTHKNKQAVLDLTNYYGFAISAKQIFSGDGAVSKTSNFLELARSYPASQYIYIDDNLRNLSELDKLLAGQIPLTFNYADWGYGSEQTLTHAKVLGFSVQSQQSFIDRYLPL